MGPYGKSGPETVPISGLGIASNGLGSDGSPEPFPGLAGTRTPPLGSGQLGYL